MNCLLDTHTFLWWDSSQTRLSKHAVELCQSSENTLFLSLASIWELQIKVLSGKLAIRLPLSVLVQEQVETNGLHLLPILPEHVYTLHKLPDLHRDPFDRMLIAQAMHERMVLISHDSLIAQYPIAVYW